MRGRENILQKDAEDIQEALRAKPNQENATVELFRGELSEEGKKHLRETYGAMNTLSDLTPTGMSIALVDSGGGMDGVVLGNRVYLDYRTIEDGTFAKPLVEEVTHFSEGTETYADAIKFISEDDVLRQGVYDALTGDGNSYGFTTELADRTLEKLKKGEELTAEEDTFARELNAHMSAEALGTESFMKKLVKGKPKLAEKLIARIKALQAALSKSETPEARTQRKRLAKAEKLWMKAVEDAGAKEMMKYFGANKEKEEEAAASAENVQDAGEENSESETEITVEKFQRDLREWFDNTTSEERSKSGRRFNLGKTTEVLKSIDVKDADIYFGASKINKILEGNKSMSTDTIAQAVTLLQDPILIMESTTVADSIVIFGEVYTEGNKPVMISVLINPKNKNGEILDYIVITSEYGRRASNLQNMINQSRIYYVCEDKKRTDAWLKALGLQLPSALTKYSSIDSIIENPPKVKLSDKKTSEKVSTSGKPQFSLPAKPQSAGARAKSNANRSRSKTFTREDAALIAEAVVDDSTVFAGEDGGMYRSKFQGKVKLIDRLWVRLNEIEDQRSRDIYSEKLADSIIAHTVVTLSADDPTMEAMTDRVKALKGYFRKLDLSSIKGDLKDARGGERYLHRRQKILNDLVEVLLGCALAIESRDEWLKAPSITAQILHRIKNTGGSVVLNVGIGGNAVGFPFVFVRLVSFLDNSVRNVHFRLLC